MNAGESLRDQAGQMPPVRPRKHGPEVQNRRSGAPRGDAPRARARTPRRGRFAQVRVNLSARRGRWWRLPALRSLTSVRAGRQGRRPGRRKTPGAGACPFDVRTGRAGARQHSRRQAATTSGVNDDGRIGILRTRIERRRRPHQRRIVHRPPRRNIFVGHQNVARMPHGEIVVGIQAESPKKAATAKRFGLSLAGSAWSISGHKKFKWCGWFG
jgi:hypothetical protein